MIPLIGTNAPRGYTEMATRMPISPDSKDCHVYQNGLLRIIVSIDGGDRHLSISHRDRYPTWDEILEARNWYFPEEMEVVMVLARKSEYVNIHKNCFHLWQSKCGEEGR